MTQIQQHEHNAVHAALQGTALRMDPRTRLISQDYVNLCCVNVEPHPAFFSFFCGELLCRRTSCSCSPTHFFAAIVDMDRSDYRPVNARSRPESVHLKTWLREVSASLNRKVATLDNSPRIIGAKNNTPGVSLRRLLDLQGLSSANLPPALCQGFDLHSGSRASDEGLRRRRASWTAVLRRGGAGR